jgi:hypothetical protein
MKKIYIVISITENGKRHAFSETIRTGENLKAHFKRYPNADIIHLCETATQAGYLAAEWNESYKKNGEYLY